MFHFQMFVTPSFPTAEELRQSQGSQLVLHNDRSYQAGTLYVVLSSAGGMIGAALGCVVLVGCWVV